MTNNIPIYNRNTINYGEIQNTFVTNYFFFFYQTTVISFGGNKIARVIEAGVSSAVKEYRDVRPDSTVCESFVICSACEKP